MKKILIGLVVGYSIICVGCQSDQKLKKPSGKWEAVNIIEKPAIQPLIKESK